LVDGLVATGRAWSALGANATRGKLRHHTHRGTFSMPRHWLWLIGLAAATTVAGGGCRSCSTCHDYDPPVADCDCNASGCHRAGSASGGPLAAGYTSDAYVVEPPAEGPSLPDARDSRNK
jgi:hypothetical protein